MKFNKYVVGPGKSVFFASNTGRLKYYLSKTESFKGYNITEVESNIDFIFKGIEVDSKKHFYNLCYFENKNINYIGHIDIFTKHNKHIYTIYNVY